jgi:Domain of unknown function (DUF4169)
MGEIVNLRRARKRQANEAAEREAAANRFAHGRPKDERRRLKAEREAETKRLDGHRLQPSGDGD